MLSLSDCQNDRGILAVANVDPATQNFTDLVNEADRRLVDRGDWWATVVKIKLAVSGRWIVHPRNVTSVVGITDFGSALTLRNQWYQFLPTGREDYCSCWRTHGHQPRSMALADLGITPVVNNITRGAANYLIAVARNSADYGRNLYVWGTNKAGWPVNETIALAPPYTPSANTYANITRVEKDITADFTDLYQCASNTPATLDAASGVTIMGSYAPSETRAEYRVTELPAHRTNGSAVEITALVKLKHIDVIAPTDLLATGNAAAIKLMMLSVRDEEASDPQKAEAESARAVQELNFELRNYLPEDQIPVRVSIFGTAPLRNQPL